jgi:predicted aconitase with swiveling domain
VRALVAGRASGELVVLDEGLSLWGGYEPTTGCIVDRNHPQFGESLVAKIVYMPHGRGSSSSSSVLAEAMRVGTAPAGFVLGEPDSILVIGSLVSRFLYGVECPIYVGDPWELGRGVVRLGDT